MARHCYDTSILIGLLRDDPQSLELVCNHEDANERRATTVISCYELAEGSNNVREKNSAAQIIETMVGLELDMHTAFIAGQHQCQLREMGKTAPLRDLLIGTIAKEAGWRLHTFDKKFPSLEGLDLVIH